MSKSQHGDQRRDSLSKVSDGDNTSVEGLTIGKLITDPTWKEEEEEEEEEEEGQEKVRGEGRGGGRGSRGERKKDKKTIFTIHYLLLVPITNSSVTGHKR